MNINIFHVWLYLKRIFFIPRFFNALLLLQSKMAQEKGVNVSRHEVHTEDGYWLAVHRVGNPRGTPVLLVHGLLASSDQWLILGRSESYREYPDTSKQILFHLDWF